VAFALFVRFVVTVHPVGSANRVLDFFLDHSAYVAHSSHGMPDNSARLEVSPQQQTAIIAVTKSSQQYR
jgi:hypothetical protein